MARTVYASVYLAVGLAYWLMFNILAGVIAAIVMIAVTNAMMMWARAMRRRRGLTPLPSVWRSPRS